MKITLLIQTMLVALFCSACANVAGWRPHGQMEYQTSDLKPWEKRDPSSIQADTKPVLLVGQINDLSVPPVGALYQEFDFAEAPLVEVYHLSKPGSFIADALPGALKASGFRAYRDASDLGNAVNLDGVFPKGLLVLRIDIVSLSYSRHSQGFDAFLGEYRVHVFSADTNEKLHTVESDFKVRLDWDFESMVLPLDGFETIAETMVRTLVQDDGFLKTVGGA